MPHDFITLPKQAKDITGQRFGRLVALGPVGKTKSSNILWLCQCDCGKSLIVRSPYLTSGSTQSCGCFQRDCASRLNRTHGMEGTHLYEVWHGIIQRCTNAKSKGYARYGGRGITICDEWRHDFEAFYSHVSQLPHCEEKGYSLDRANNSLGYFPGNVRWATRTEQQRNRRDNQMLTHNGKTQCVADWEDELGMDRYRLKNRLRNGWDAERAITTPVTKRTSKKDY